MDRKVLITLFVTTCITVMPLRASQDSERPQDQSGPPAPIFKAQSNLVVLHVNVFDGRSDAVEKLPQSAFQVLEDGKPQAITFFNDTDVPVAVGLVIDNSSSMLTRRSMVLAGTTAFAESSHPEDQVFTIVFNEHVRFGLPEHVPFTTNQQQVKAGLTRFAPGGMTALYDAVIDGLDHLQQATNQKHVLIVLSDGDDNASQHSEADMLHRASRSDALIYTISTADFATDTGKPQVLKRLAARSGGVFYSPRREKDVISSFTEIAQNIRRGYSIGYTPADTSATGDYRRVQVVVRVPGRTLSVRARDGYTAGRDTNSQ